jgi:hypothetical protein
VGEREQREQDERAALADVAKALAAVPRAYLPKFADLLFELPEDKEIVVAHHSNGFISIGDIRAGVKLVRALERLSPAQRDALRFGASLHDPRDPSDRRGEAVARLIDDGSDTLSDEPPA